MDRDVIGEILSGVKAQPDALLNNNRRYEDVARWPIDTVGRLKKTAGYDMEIQRQHGWIEFTNRARPIKEKSTGWKFHVSVSEADVPKLYEMLFPTILRYGISCKFADPSTAKLHDSNLAPKQTGYNTGKMFVIYCDDRKPAFFLGLCQSIELALQKRGIGPGKPVPPESNFILRGSLGYTFYRNDRDLSGNYIRQSGPNPFKQPDPFVYGFSDGSYAQAQRTPGFMKPFEAHAYTPA